MFKLTGRHWGNTLKKIHTEVIIMTCTVMPLLDRQSLRLMQRLCVKRATEVCSAQCTTVLLINTLLKHILMLGI